MPTQLWEVKCWLFTKYLESCRALPIKLNGGQKTRDMGRDVRVPLSHLNTGLALIACWDSHFGAWLVPRYPCRLQAPCIICQM